MSSIITLGDVLMIGTLQMVRIYIHRAITIVQTEDRAFYQGSRIFWWSTGMENDDAFATESLLRDFDSDYWRNGSKKPWF